MTRLGALVTTAAILALGAGVAQSVYDDSSSYGQSHSASENGTRKVAVDDYAAARSKAAADRRFRMVGTTMVTICLLGSFALLYRMFRSTQEPRAKSASSARRYRAGGSGTRTRAGATRSDATRGGATRAVPRRDLSTPEGRWARAEHLHEKVDAAYLRARSTPLVAINHLQLWDEKVPATGVFLGFYEQANLMRARFESLEDLDEDTAAAGSPESPEPEAFAAAELQELADEAVPTVGDTAAADTAAAGIGGAAESVGAEPVEARRGVALVEYEEVVRAASRAWDNAQKSARTVGATHLSKNDQRLVGEITARLKRAAEAGSSPLDRRVASTEAAEMIASMELNWPEEANATLGV